MWVYAIPKCIGNRSTNRNRSFFKESPEIAMTENYRQKIFAIMSRGFLLLEFAPLFLDCTPTSTDSLSGFDLQWLLGSWPSPRYPGRYHFQFPPGPSGRVIMPATAWAADGPGHDDGDDVNAEKVKVPKTWMMKRKKSQGNRFYS